MRRRYPPQARGQVTELARSGGRVWRSSLSRPRRSGWRSTTRMSSTRATRHQPKRLPGDRDDPDRAAGRVGSDGAKRSTRPAEAEDARSAEVGAARPYTLWSGDPGVYLVGSSARVSLVR